MTSTTPSSAQRSGGLGRLGPAREDLVFGAGYTAWDIPLGADTEGSLRGVLLHRDTDATTDDAAPGDERPAILLLHGWSDYILDRDLTEHLGRRGYDVWAVDLRKHGRALNPGQTPTEIDHLSRYDAELDTALAAIGRPPILLAHSTGGLTATLYAQRHPGALTALALNSPWLELHYGPVSRWLLAPLVAAAARRLGSRPLLPRGVDHYARTLHVDLGGEYHYDPRWKPFRGDPFPADTLAAVLDGQRRLAAAGPLNLPILVLHSARSRFRLRFHEDLGRADVILDVRAMDRRARRLGPNVQVVVLADARHDVFLSAAPVRARALAALDTWLYELPGTASTMGRERA